MSTAIDWRADNSGMIVGARIHDGHLRQLSYTDGVSLRLAVRRVSGEDVEVALTNLLAFGAAGFSHGAIVSEMYAWKLDSIPTLAWDAPDNPWRVLFAGDAGAEGIRASASKFVRDYPDAFLVQVSCSYGGSIAAICGSISITENKRTS